MQRTKALIEEIQEYDFLSTYKVEQNARIKIKLQALHHLQLGKSIKEVSSITFYNEKSVRHWICMFVVFDYEGLIDREGRGRKPRLGKSEEEVFRERLDELQESMSGGRVTVYDIQELLADEFNCCYSRSGVYALLDRLNIVWISGRSKHPKHSQEAIDQFKESFPDEIEGIKDKIESDKIEVWWQDESRIGQQGSLSRVWATKGTRPRVVRQRQFLSTYIFGAVCPDRDVGCALILPQCNSGMMQIHLDQISEHVKKGHHAILLMDRAGWHTTEALNVPKNITLMPLPPYSPELNPMEQVWQQLRKIKLSNTNFKDYDDIVDSCCEAWNCFCDEDGNIQNLCTRDWAVI
ncbi:MAG: IS630 family transposase [Candidatus Omnitrophica bacterium]|nr:IS630 family transposase [Candidatus Omnitrophota bacterium]